ncbi:MAG TPA: hypothetical protein VMA35_16065 [Candidatus Sulfopaludibacter sp.]|nr:hypothetical protein [Candidatus Sulfopaludibacter sp.]
MKVIAAPLIAAFVIFLAGCATGSCGLALDTVGPMPAQTAMVNPTNGTLVVYSAFAMNADFNSRDPYRPEYSDYKIFTTNGELLRQVHNDSGTVLQDPATVELPTGGYRVVARANGYGRLMIPIIIEAKRTTVLHLEGGGAWPDKSVFNQTNAVRLPDGRIVGWRAPGNSSG